MLCELDIMENWHCYLHTQSVCCLDEVYHRVHIIAQPVNIYIVTFHIAVSYNIYSHTRWQQSRDADGGRSSTY